MENTIKAEWVIGTYTGDRAKSVKAHADAGIGYFVQRSAGMGTNYTVDAAFRRAVDGPRPEHLEACSEQQIAKLEALREARQGLTHQEDRRGSKALPDFRSLMGGRS